LPHQVFSCCNFELLCLTWRWPLALLFVITRRARRSRCVATGIEQNARTRKRKPCQKSSSFLVHLESPPQFNTLEIVSYMDNEAIARRFYRLSALMEVRGDDPFRLRSYRNAA